MRVRPLVAIAASLLLASACASRAPAPVAAKDSWLVAVNTGVWFETFDRNAGGAGFQGSVARAVRPHLLVGVRVTGQTEIDINDPPKKNVAHLFDAGPTIGTGASWSRLSLSAAAGPVVTHVKHDDDPWTSAWTLGLGLDAGVTVRTFGFIGLGLHVTEDLNPEQSATAIAVRVEASLR